MAELRVDGIKGIRVGRAWQMIESLDREASRLGVPRQSLIKMLIAKHLDQAS
jgi:hypothetical protein